MSDTVIWLCFVYGEGSQPMFRGWYTTATEAEAWLAGVKAAYMGGEIVAADPGPFDFAEWKKARDE